MIAVSKAAYPFSKSGTILNPSTANGFIMGSHTSGTSVSTYGGYCGNTKFLTNATSGTVSSGTPIWIYLLPGIYEYSLFLLPITADSNNRVKTLQLYKDSAGFGQPITGRYTSYESGSVIAVIELTDASQVFLYGRNEYYDSTNARELNALITIRPIKLL